MSKRQYIHQRQEHLSPMETAMKKAFPELDSMTVKKINEAVLDKVRYYEPENKMEEVSIFLQCQLGEHVKSKNTRKIRKVCNRLARSYWKNNRRCNLQESWFGLLAYLISIPAMITRILDVQTRTNDWVTLGMYVAITMIWLALDKFHGSMGEKVERFLTAFNHHISSWTVVSALIFYTAVCGGASIEILIGSILLPFMVCIWLTWDTYQKK